MEKKRGLSKLWKLLLPAMLLAMLLGMSSMAAGTQVVDMTADGNGGYTYTGKEVDSTTTYYHRIVVPSAGMLEIGGYKVYVYKTLPPSTGYLPISLCDANFAPLDASSYVSVNGADDTEVYGLKKGVYYIKITGCENYVLAAQYTKYTDNGGSSKKKAKTFKLNKTVKGVVAAGEKKTKADWFKVKVTKKKRLYLTITAQGNAPIAFKLYGPSYKNGISLGTLYNQTGTYWSVSGLSRKKTKVTPGTYYIKVTRSTSYPAGSGVYSIKCKLK